MWDILAVLVFILVLAPGFLPKLGLKGIGNRLVKDVISLLLLPFRLYYRWLYKWPADVKGVPFAILVQLVLLATGFSVAFLIRIIQSGINPLLYLWPWIPVVAMVLYKRYKPRRKTYSLPRRQCRY